jgi:hypothetical protein
MKRLVFFLALVILAACQPVRVDPLAVSPRITLVAGDSLPVDITYNGTVIATTVYYAPTLTPTSTPTITPSRTATFTPVPPTLTNTPTATRTSTPTVTPTNTPTITPTPLPDPNATQQFTTTVQYAGGAIVQVPNIRVRVVNASGAGVNGVVVAFSFCDQFGAATCASWNTNATLTTADAPMGDGSTVNGVVDFGAPNDLWVRITVGAVTREIYLPPTALWWFEKFAQ